jgi:hypothetical protein
MALLQEAPPPRTFKAERPLSAWSWHFHLLFSPRAFFRQFATQKLPLLTAACAWMYGMSSVIDRSEMNALQDKPPPWMESWGVYWGVILAGGAFAGLCYFAIGGWWYRQRLKWSGDPNPDATVAKRVYLYSSQVMVVPLLFIAAFQSWSHPTPLAAFRGDAGAWDVVTALVVIVAAFWSVGTSFVGVRTMFAVQALPALIWFAILPALVYAVAFVAGVLLALLPALLVEKAPDLEHPRKHRNPTLSFQHPGNWQAQLEQLGEDEFTIALSGPPDAQINVQVYWPAGSPAEELAATLQSFSALESWREGAGFDAWGRMDGAGAQGNLLVEGTPVDVSTFVTELAGGRFFEIQATWARADAAHVLPVVEMVGRTLRVE